MVRLSFHDFDKAEHFVGAVLLLVALGRQIKRMLCGKKLHDLEAAFVEVKVDIPLFKIRSKGFPHLGFGMQCLYCLPCAVSDAPAVDFRGGEQDIQLIVAGGPVDFQDHAAYFLPVADNAVGFAVRCIQTGLDGLAGDDLALAVQMIVPHSKLLHGTIPEGPLIVQDELLPVGDLQRDQTDGCVLHYCPPKRKTPDHYSNCNNRAHSTSYPTGGLQAFAYDPLHYGVLSSDDSTIIAYLEQDCKTTD